MAGYSPLKIIGNTEGLIQNREEFLLPDDAYPTLQNAYVWRERLKRKKGCQLLGRLERQFTNFSLGSSSASPWSFNIYTAASITGEPNAQIDIGTVVVYVGTSAPGTGSISTYNNTTNCEVTTSAPHGLSTGNVVTISGVVVKPNTGPNNINGGPYTISVVNATNFTINSNSESWGIYASGGTWTQEIATSVLFDQGNGTLATNPASGVTGTINYLTGAVVITGAAGSVASAINFAYFPGLPVMGICKQEQPNSATDQTIFFDQKYAYKYIGSPTKFSEYLANTGQNATWNAAGVGVSGTDFFWSTNYWVSANPPFTTPVSAVPNQKLLWVTNGSGGENNGGDPPRITDGFRWINFTQGAWHQIDATTYLFNWLCNLPFRGRMVVFNTYEGTVASGAPNYPNRIRWSTIGNPFIAYAAGPPATGSWRDDIRGQGGFLDIPTSEDIVSVGFVRDNLVIYCERSTWQLRYTGRSISPFQIEKVNSELGVEGTFSSIQFDTSLVGIGDKGIVECNSYSSKRIDIKIPDFVFDFNSYNNGVARLQGVRNFRTRIAYWTIPLVAFYPNSTSINQDTDWIFPTARLLYNYENDSWAIFNDSLTTLGTFQLINSPTWLDITIPWIEYTKSWLDDNATDPVIVGGNQQGFIEMLDQLSANDVSLYISNVAITNSVVQITAPNHNMQTGFIIGISGIVTGTPFSDLNGNVYAINVLDASNFTLLSFDTNSQQFDQIVNSTTLPGTYIGGGLINIRENFYINSKKFNFLDEGQNIQMGYIDILTLATQNGAFSLNVYINYDDQTPSNTLEANEILGSTPQAPDTFFNAIIPTSASTFAVAPQGTKFWQRVFCPTRANFLTLQYTLSPAQMNGIEQQSEVQIDAQVLWLRRAGRLTQF